MLFAVEGTVVRSEFYSENGEEPVGEISVTKYSTDPKDLAPHDDFVKSGDVISVTTTQRFGQKGTPSLKSVVEKKRAGNQATTESEDETRTKTSTTKVTRRGSVKALSQKFIENAGEPHDA